jgi:RNA polymerase sigma-70 factor (ECF subfamily)
MELYSDIYYVHKVLDGDAACFACLLDRYSRQVFSLISRVVGNREDAEELTQDVFMKVFRNLSSFKEESSFSTWVYRIAYNTAISATRKKKYEFLAIHEAQTEHIPEDIPASVWEAGLSERIDDLERALAVLPPDERLLILLFYMQEKTVEEVAAISGLSKTNVKTRMFRIRKKLFLMLNEKKERQTNYAYLR